MKRKLIFRRPLNDATALSELDDQRLDELDKTKSEAEKKEKLPNPTILSRIWLKFNQQYP